MAGLIVVIALVWLGASVVAALVAGRLLRAGAAADEVVDLRDRPSPPSPAPTPLARGRRRPPGP